MSKIIMTGGGGTVDLDVITAAAADVKSGKVIVDKDGNPINGTMAAVAGRTVTPGTSNQTVISSGQWANGNIVVAGDSDLAAGNILYGKNIFGVAGNVRKAATLKKVIVSSSSRLSFNNVSGGKTSMYYIEIPNLGFTPTAISCLQKDSDPSPYAIGFNDGTWWVRGSSCTWFWDNGDGSISWKSSLLRIPCQTGNDEYHVTVSGYY